MIKSNVIMLMFAVLCFASCEKQTPEEPKPMASFYASTTNANVGDNIYITNNSKDADHYVWDFGDGQTSTEPNPCHAYSSKGVYNVKLTAYSPTGEKYDDMQMIINVTEATPEEPKPTALFSASTTNANVGDNIYFNNKSTEADHYVWVFGDGSPSSTEPNPCHVYSSKGVYAVKLTAYSSSGEKFDEMTIIINVTEPEPPQEPTPTALFSASTTNASVDDDICFTNKSMNAHHYEWDFGDGQTSTEPNPCHAYSSKGVYYVQLTAYSSTGECNVTGMNINVEDATGSIMFWMNSPGYIVTVELDGIKKEINAYYPNYNPDCGDEGCATFNDLPVGEHYYRAESYDGWWSGYITIKKGVCTRMLLLREKATPFKDGDMPTVEKRMAERIE